MQLGNRCLVELANARLDERRKRADSAAAVAGSNSVDHPDHGNPRVSRQRQRREPLARARNASDRISRSQQVRRKQPKGEAGRNKTGECNLAVPAERGTAGMGGQRLESKGRRAESKWG